MKVHLHLATASYMYLYHDKICTSTYKFENVKFFKYSNFTHFISNCSSFYPAATGLISVYFQLFKILCYPTEAFFNETIMEKQTEFDRFVVVDGIVFALRVI